MRLNIALHLLPSMGALFAALGAQAAPTTLEAQFSARVIHVDDGDTVVALKADQTRVKVRLANIDAPETNHGRCRPGQPWSAQSTEALKHLVHGRTIHFTCSTLDRYDRSVCDLQLDNGKTTANRELARMGLAWANRARPSFLRDAEVAAAEGEARKHRIGLWAGPSVVPPWEWRQTEWQQPGCGQKERGWP